MTRNSHFPRPAETDPYEVAGGMEDGVEAAGAAAGKEEGGAEAAFAAKEA